MRVAPEEFHSAGLVPFQTTRFFAQIGKGKNIPCGAALSTGKSGPSAFPANPMW